MIESGSFCTVEGVKVSAFGFSSLRRVGCGKPARRREEKELPGNGAEIMKTPFYIFNYRGGHCRGAVGTCTV